MKTYTDIKQSAQLALLLPTESADMWWSWLDDPFDDENGGEYKKEPLLHKPVCNPEKAIPCWSLIALLEIIPFPHLSWYKYKSSPLKWNCVSIPKLDSKDISPIVEVRDFSNAIDACYELILKLHYQNFI